MFKKGDRVFCINTANSNNLLTNRMYKISKSSYDHIGAITVVRLHGQPYEIIDWRSDRFIPTNNLLDLLFEA